MGGPSHGCECLAFARSHFSSTVLARRPKAAEAIVRSVGRPRAWDLDKAIGNVHHTATSNRRMREGTGLSVLRSGR